MTSSMSVVVSWLMSSGEHFGRGALVKSALELAIGEPDMFAAIEVWGKFISSELTRFADGLKSSSVPKLQTPRLL